MALLRGTRYNLSKNLRDVIRMLGDCRLRMPAPESAICVDGANPFSQSCALRLVLFDLLSFGFQNEHFIVRQSNQEVGAIAMLDAVVHVKNLEAEMVVLGPRLDVATSVKVQRF